MRILLVALSTVFLAACGGSGSGNPNSGTLTIAITDASIADYQEALLEISSITLIGSGGQETEVLDAPETVDLLALRNVSEILLHKSLPDGAISKIRLGVDSITLNKLDMDGNVTDTDRPPVPTRKIDLNPQGPMEIRAGEDLLLVLDVDLQNSIKVNETGNERVRFRPLVRLTTEVSSFVRLYGTYTDDGSDGTDVSICNLERVSDVDGDYQQLDMCVALVTTNAAYFGVDGLPLVDGEPADRGDLADGELVSVYGYYQTSGADEVLSVEILARGNGNRGEAFNTVNGVAMTDWNTMGMRRFDLSLADSLSIVVELSDGAKVFDIEGTLLMEEAIAEGQRTEARGALTSSTDEADWLQSFIAFVSGVDNRESRSGEISEINGNEITLTDLDDTQNCVLVTANTAYYNIDTNLTDDVTDTTEIQLDKLMSGDMIDASGGRLGNCISATTVIRETESTTP